MYKKVISISLVAMAAMFSGCGNSDTTCRIDVQKAIDEGRYDDAIADMNGSCKNAFDASDLAMNMASAYMGKSGYSVSDISDMLINNNNGKNAFSSFLSSVNKKKQPDSLPLLNKANTYYINSIATNGDTNTQRLCSPENVNKNARAANACLYIGFNQTVITANTVTYLTGNVDQVVKAIDDNTQTNKTPYDMKASLDALNWVVNASYTPDNNTKITGPTPVTIQGEKFAKVIVTYSDNGEKVFYRLAKSSTRETNNTTVITDGYCDKDGNRTACADINNSDGSIDMSNTNAGNCYACPIVFDANNSSTDVAQLLVNTLNGGTDTIISVSNDKNIKKSINDFKKNITGSIDGNVTIDEIIKYLNK